MHQAVGEVLKMHPPEMRSLARSKPERQTEAWFGAVAPLLDPWIRSEI